MFNGFYLSESSPNMLYTLVIGGDESAPKYVIRNMVTGKELFDTLYLKPEMGITFFDPERPDAFYYSKFPNFKKPGVDPINWIDSSTINYHIIGTKPSMDKTIIGMNNLAIERNADDYFELIIKKNIAYAFAILQNKVSLQYRIYAVPKNELNGTQTQWKKLTNFDDKVSKYTFYGNYLYLLTQKNAPNSKVLRLDLRDGSFDKAIEIIPNSKKLVKDIAATKNELLVTLTDAGVGKLISVKHGSSKADTLQTPIKGNLNVKWFDLKEDFYIIGITSYVKPPEYFTYNPALKKFEHSVVQKYFSKDIAPLEVKQVFVKSHDGVMVPMTIIYKKGLKLDGTHPVSLNAYGAYGYTNDPYFFPENMVWFNYGGISATGHVRGGGIYGEEWKVAGQKKTKPNTWKDFIACAEYLIANKYATNKNLVGRGGSAGGITIGRAITERPDLFGAAFIDVGTLDMIRAETSPNGKGNIPEFGSIATEEGFNALYEMSAYHHVKNGVKYPTVILSHGVNDARVPVWTSLKMAARLQDASSSENPILLYLNFDSGHGIQQTMSSTQSYLADRTAFIFWKAGLPEFQPVIK